MDVNATRDEIVPVTVRHPSAAGVALAGLAALAVAMGIGRFAFTPILPMMQADTGLTLAEGGWLASANYAGYLVGALSAVAIRVPAALTIRSGTVLIGLVTAGMGVELPFAGLVTLRALAGVASAWVLVSVSAWSLARLTPLRRPVLTGTVFAGVGVGIALAGIVCAVLMRGGASSAQAWIVLGALALGLTATTWPVFANDADPERREDARTASAPARWTLDELRLVLCYGIFGFGYIIPATFLPVMARAEVEETATFVLAWPVFGLAAAASTYAGALSPRIGGNRRLWMVSQLVTAVGVAVPLVVPGLGGILLSALCVGGTFVVNTMTGMQEARIVAAADAPRLMAAMTAAFALGQILGPLLVGYATEAGATFALPLLLASGLLAISVFLLTPPRSR